MRLIDADKTNPSDVIGDNNEFASDIRKAMQDLIDSQPTAYDVDKVIDKIRNIPHGAILNVALEEEIIEIVKSGYVTVAGQNIVQIHYAKIKQENGYIQK